MDDLKGKTIIIGAFREADVIAPLARGLMRRPDTYAKLCDCRMPTMQGSEFIQKIAALRMLGQMPDVLLVDHQPGRKLTYNILGAYLVAAGETTASPAVVIFAPDFGDEEQIVNSIKKQLPFFQEVTYLPLPAVAGKIISHIDGVLGTQQAAPING